MRHVIIRSILGLIWLAAAIISGVSGHVETAGLYVILCGVFLYAAFATWKKEKDKRGGE